MMDPIEDVKPKDSRTLIAAFQPKTGATEYVIRIQNSNGFHREDTVSSSPAKIQNLTPYTEYELSVMAVNGGGRSLPPAPVTAKTSNVVSFTIFIFFNLYSKLATKRNQKFKILRLVCKLKESYIH